MRNIKKIIFVNRMKLYLIIIFCVIIICIIKTFAVTYLNSRGIKYNGQVLNCYTDAIRFHTNTNGYDVILNQELPNNFYAYRDMDYETGPGAIPSNISETYKTKGYGNYVFKEDTNLFTFVEWCHTVNAGYTEACSYRAGATPEKEWNYTKLMGYKNVKMSKDAIDHMNYFWQNMSTLLGETFKEYQDSYYFEKYVLKGMNKAGMTVAKIRNAQRAHENGDEEVSGVEYMTAITSYMFALTPQSPDNFTVGKGDIVPFLYYKMNREEDNPRELARYAYIPLIEGWCTQVVGTNLWLQEYLELYGDYNEDEFSEDLETLQEWYDEIYDKYKTDKGRKGNNLLGSDITTIIQSDYSVSDQLEATEVYLDNMFNELGLERSYKENIARNQMMAEYMMQDSGLDETIKDYNVSIKFTTENLQRGTFEPKNSHTAVLSDYQFIKLNHTLDRDGHSDNDGLSDLHELGNIKWMDITSFVEKTYNNMKANGELCKNSLIEQIIDIVDKQGGNYLEKRWGHVKVEGSGDNMKVYYRTYDYTSNPVLDDTDFDGLNDNKDSKKLNGTFIGTSTDIGKVSYNNDFRWFFTNKNKYNDELAAMSLIASNLANGKTISTDQVSGNIIQYLSNLGFTDVRGVGENGSVYMGKKTITYYGVTKNIYAVILGGGETKSNYRAIFNYVNEEDTQTISLMFKENKKMTIQDIASDIANDAYFSTMDNTFWVTGYGVAGSLASEVAAKLTDKGGEVFCYTFGATNTGVGVKGSYPNIKNVINEDDYVPKIVNPDVYQRPGQTYSSSIKEDLMREYRDIVGDTNYKGDFYLSNYLGKVFKESLTGMSLERLNQLLYEWSRHLEYYGTIPKDLQENAETGDVAIAIDAMKEANKDARSIKAYYVLAKSLNGFDLTDGNGAKIAKYGQVRLLSTDSSETHIEGENDAVPFTDCYLMGKASFENIKDFDYQGEERIIDDDQKSNIDWCYKLTGNGDFKYSNYTIPSEIDSYDIIYSQFWNKDIDVLKSVESNYDENSNYLHYFLYNNKAGDFNYDRNDIGTRKSKMIYGRYHYKNQEREDFINEHGEQYMKMYNSDVGECNMKTLDGRIIAAFPLNLLLRTDEDVLEDLYKNEMHIYKNYDHSDNKHGDMVKNKDTQKINEIAESNKLYKLVDVVMQSSDGYQYVIPFTVVDVKWIHHKPVESHYAMFVDNTYGHVYNGSNDNGTLSYENMNPIEPYLQVLKKGNGEDGYDEKADEVVNSAKINNKLFEVIYGSLYTRDKIISMRLYDKTFEEDNPNWWKNIRDRMEEKTTDDYRASVDNGTQKYDGKVVDY